MGPTLDVPLYIYFFAESLNSLVQSYRGHDQLRNGSHEYAGEEETAKHL